MYSGRATLMLVGLLLASVAGLFYSLPGGDNSAVAQVPNQWTIEFIPRRAESVSIVIDGRVWNPRRTDCSATWERREGRVQWTLPAEFARAERLRIVAVSYPAGSEAEVVVRHNGRERQKMVFFKTEESEVIR